MKLDKLYVQIKELTLNNNFKKIVVYLSPNLIERYQCFTASYVSHPSGPLSPKEITIS